MSRVDVICDHSQQDLKVVPLRVLEMCNLQMLYLEGNGLEALPTNIFQKLPKLIWLDLRNNKLRDIPTGIANHAWLENLLLEQNSLERLPNELGLVPKLVVLQLSKNPLIYPSKDIISQGTQAISLYLRNEYNKENGLPQELGANSTTSDKNKKTVKRKKKVIKEKIDIRELLRKSSHHSRLSVEHMPTISIKSLSSEACHVIKNEDSVKSVVCAIHSPRNTSKAIRYCSKLSIPTHYNSNKYVGIKKPRAMNTNDTNSHKKILDHELKAIWIEKLKGLLEEQERRLQQERNLQALSSWRLMQKLEQPREVKANAKLLEVPYDTNPDYERMPSRSDLAKDVEKIVKRRKNVPKKSSDLQKLINELVSQLKVLEVANDTNQPQNSEIEKNEKEIQTIISLHKRVMELQQKNESSL